MITNLFESSPVSLVCTRLSHQIQEELVHHISVLKSQADEKKHKLSKLRTEVLEGPTVSTLCTVVQGFIERGEGGGEGLVPRKKIKLNIFLGASPSLVPRPHPLTRRNGLVNQVEFLGLAHAFATL